jgi:hypothetical protein
MGNLSFGFFFLNYLEFFEDCGMGLDHKVSTQIQ